MFFRLKRIVLILIGLFLCVLVYCMISITGYGSVSRSIPEKKRSGKMEMFRIREHRSESHVEEYQHIPVWNGQEETVDESPDDFQENTEDKNNPEPSQKNNELDFQQEKLKRNEELNSDFNRSRGPIQIVNAVNLKSDSHVSQNTKPLPLDSVVDDKSSKINVKHNKEKVSDVEGQQKVQSDDLKTVGNELDDNRLSDDKIDSAGTVKASEKFKIKLDSNDYVLQKPVKQDRNGVESKLRVQESNGNNNNDEISKSGNAVTPVEKQSVKVDNRKKLKFTKDKFLSGRQSKEILHTSQKNFTLFISSNPLENKLVKTFHSNLTKDKQKFDKKANDKLDILKPLSVESEQNMGADVENSLIEERRKIFEEKKKLMEDKMKFDQEVQQIMNELRVGNVLDVRNKMRPRPRTITNPADWEGIDSSEAYKKYPGIIFMRDYRINRTFVDPNDTLALGMQGSPRSLADMNDGQVEERFFQLLSEFQLDCQTIRRVGSTSDGGWDVCGVPPYELKPGCLVYSFGINFDFTFDDAIASKYGCQVKAFDPSMAIEDHVHSEGVHFYRLGLGKMNTVTDQAWKLMTLGSIREKLGHSQSVVASNQQALLPEALLIEIKNTPAVIDVLKIDIDFSEWDCFENILEDHSLHNVKQLIFEMHTPEVQNIYRPSTIDDFSRFHTILHGLETQGFRRFNTHFNPLDQYASPRTGKLRSCCYELYYVNIHFMR